MFKSNKEVGAVKCRVSQEKTANVEHFLNDFSVINRVYCDPSIYLENNNLTAM
uniref:Uncharacterized protein n=1 Tax=Octopus bimaculoides TaxID=37653 RepID=A0A0L8GXJ0_OCTBM